jgi:hypothetical protein
MAWRPGSYSETPERLPRQVALRKLSADRGQLHLLPCPHPERARSPARGITDRVTTIFAGQVRKLSMVAATMKPELIVRMDSGGGPRRRIGRCCVTTARDARSIGRARRRMVWTTAGQLRARRLSPAGLEPVAWLYYNRLPHRISRSTTGPRPARSVR